MHKNTFSTHTAAGLGLDHENYDTVNSPTVSTAAISAKEGRHRMTTDVPAAYINAKMDPSMPKVHMRMDAANMALLVEVTPKWQQ